MTLSIPVGFAQASLQFRNDNDPDPWYVTFGVDVSEAGGDYEAIALRIQHGVDGGLAHLIATDTTLTGVQLRVGQDAQDPLTLFFAYSVDGLSAAETLPQNCALLVTKQTTRSGRTGKGRMFIPCVNEGGANNVGVLTSEYLALVQGRVTTFLEFLSDPATTFPPPAPMVLLHSTTAPGGTTPTPVIALAVAPTIATQRRRLR